MSQERSNNESSWPFVLVVEDNECNRHFMVKLVERIGVKAQIVSNGVEALRAVESCDFDAILMDLKMPEMDGLECTRQIRKYQERTGKYTPIMAITACAMPGDKERCIAAGMDYYLPKPINVNALEEKLKSWIGAQGTARDAKQSQNRASQANDGV